MTQPALSPLETGGVIPTTPLMDRISAALDAGLSSRSPRTARSQPVAVDADAVHLFVPKCPVHDVEANVSVCRMTKRLRHRGKDLKAEGAPQPDRRGVGFDDRIELHRPIAVRARLVEDVAAQSTARTLTAPITAFVETYLSEWNMAVVYPPAVAELVGALADRFRLAVVTNTHQADLVPRHLSAMGIAHFFEAVVTSVEVGWRKPHPAIYAEALLRLEVAAQDAVFVGDSYAADYLGPEAAGLTAFLIDPAERYGIPASRRLRSLDDLPVRLNIQHGAAPDIG